MKNTETAGAIVALVMLVLAAWPAHAEVGMTGLQVIPLGSIAPEQPLNEAQKLAANVSMVNLTANNTTQEAFLISAYNGPALGMYRQFGETKQMGRLFGNGYPSDRSVMETPTQAQKAVEFSRGVM